MMMNGTRTQMTRLEVDPVMVMIIYVIPMFATKMECILETSAQNHQIATSVEKMARPSFA